jgi:autotransporter-associated beta strand protein
MKMITTLKSAGLCLALLALSCPTTQAADIQKADNLDNLNLGSSWTGGATPTSADVAVWNNTITGPNLTLLGADTNWAGIRIANPVDAVTIGAGNTLTLGASGIDLSAATTNLTLGNAVNLGAAQTWSAGAGRTLMAAGVVSGVGLLTKEGDGTLVLGGANTFTTGVVNNGGTVQANNGTSFGTTASGLTNNNGTTLRVNTTTSISNPVDWNGTVTVDLNNVGGNQALRGNWSGSGVVNIINQDAVARRTFTMGGSGGWGNFTGTVNFGTNTGDFRFNDGGGSPNTGNSQAIIDLGTGIGLRFFTRNRPATVNIGELRGGAGTQIKQGTSSSGTANYNIGSLNTSSTFAGDIIDGGTSSAGFVKINKVGTGTLTLTGSGNTYAGGTTVAAGTLQMGDGGTTGDLGSGPIVVDATLVINRSDDFAMANTFSGSGLVRKTNINNLTLIGNSTASGTTVVDAGTLTVQSATYSTAISVASGATVDLSSAPPVASILAGAGNVSGLVTANPGAILSPGFNAGNGNGVAGTLSFAAGLTQSGGVLNRFDLSNDPTGTVKTNDAIAITGDLTLSGVNTVLVSPLDPALAIGTYRLITFTGGFNGDVTNNLALSGAVGYLTTNNSPNAIDLVVTFSRPPTNLTWVGDSVANVWDFATTANWNDGSAASAFFTGDNVTFNNSGSATPPVDLVAAMPAGAVLVDAANNYTFTGNGAIFGNGSLTKTNSGTLTVYTVNGYSGGTVIGGGTLALTNIVNSAQPSGLGASTSDPANLVLFPGTTLRYEGDSTTSDRGATLVSGEVTVNVSQSPANLQLGGALVGAGGLIKNGDGTLSLTAASSYSGGVVLSNGVLALESNNANASGTESGLGQTTNTVTFHGGTLQVFGYNGSTGLPGYTGVLNPLVVPAGEAGTLRLFSRGEFLAPLSGGGTLNLVVNYVRGDLRGDWSAFTGTINVTAKTGADEMRVDNNFGYANATLFLNDGVNLGRADTANTTNDIGALTGTSLATLGPGNSTGAGATWRIGWLNGNDTFAGTIANDNGNTIIKVGTGAWTLSGVNMASNTLVSTGVLAVSGSHSGANLHVASGAFLDVSLLGSLALGFGQTLGGEGTVWGGVDTSGGGTIAPGFSIGTLTVTNNASLAGIALMEVDRNSGAPLADKLVAPTIALGGTLKIVNTGAALQIGDTFDLFDGALSGGFTTLDLGYYTWDTSQLAVNGTISVTGFLPPPTLGVTFDGFNLTLNAAGGIPGSALAVVTSTDVNAPRDTWTTVLNDVFDPSGNYITIIPVDANTPQRYYAIRAL